MHIAREDNRGAVGLSGDPIGHLVGGSSGCGNYQWGHESYQHGRGHGNDCEGGHGRSAMHECDTRSKSPGGGPPFQRSTRHHHGSEHMQRPYHKLKISGGARYLSQERIKELACGNPHDLITFITENESVFLASYSDPRCCNRPRT